MLSRRWMSKRGNMIHSNFIPETQEIRNNLGCVNEDLVPKNYALYCPTNGKYIKSFTVGGDIDNECHVEFTDKIEEADTMIISKQDFENQCVNEFIKIELKEVR